MRLAFRCSTVTTRPRTSTTSTASSTGSSTSSGTVVHLGVVASRLVRYRVPLRDFRLTLAGLDRTSCLCAGPAEVLDAYERGDVPYNRDEELFQVIAATDAWADDVLQVFIKHQLLSPTETQIQIPAEIKPIVVAPGSQFLGERPGGFLRRSVLTVLSLCAWPQVQRESPDPPLERVECAVLLVVVVRRR